ncbi:MAG: ATP-binding cassette domain-containing protein [Lachnospiraceae bacterium]|nr:ATP-binding cassette domain-containing protein [Lachnospiraceae bacterium]
MKTCKALCEHLKVAAKIPTKDIVGDFSNLTKEILYLSGVRYKEVRLAADWWKHDDGALLGELQDGTPVAMLPRRLSGYNVYDPTLDAFRKIDAETAAKIKPQALAVFRSFPPKKLRAMDILGFIPGEHIYKELAVIALCSLLANLIQIIPSAVASQIFDVIVPENLRSMMVEIVLILIAFELANVGFEVMSNLGVVRINTKCGLILESALWDRLLGLRVSFFGQHTTGALLQKINGIYRIKSLMSMETLQTVLSNVFAFVYIIALFKFNAGITPLVLLMFLVLFAVNYGAGKKKYALYQRYTDLENQAMGFSHQTVRGIHRIKASCAEERVFNIWSASETDKRATMSKIKAIDNALSAFQLFFDFASTAVVYLLVSQIADVGMGVFIAYISMFLILQKSIRQLLKALGALPEFISVYANMKPILDTEPEYSTQKLIPKGMSGTLEVNHLTFRYEQYGHTILNGISFRVEENESVGIMGLSGGGKSTLLKLLMGFYDPTGGKIYYGGYDLETIDMRYLRKQMGVVLQDSQLTGSDIYSNVTDNDSTVSQAEVTEAINKAGLAEKVAALPQGLYTKLEQCPLSDGERQRLLIARALAKKCKFLFFDEATSHLDNISQGLILKNIRDIPATKIIIAQRPAAVQYCDRVIVIDNGEAVAHTLGEQPGIAPAF